MLFASPVFLLVLAAPPAAADPIAHQDIPYAEPKTERRTLDVYAPAGGKDRPVVVWVHGGGWTKGDKKGVGVKPRAFADKGYVLVSINYRFVPDV
jgi:arylformamidase